MTRTVVFIDTSVLLEVLAVPGKSQQHEAITDELRQRVKDRQGLVLPTAAVIETGNHIAQLHDGGQRRHHADRLSRIIRATAVGEAPWVMHGARWDAELLTRLCDGARGCPPLIDMAMQGVGTGDVSILAEAEAYAERVAGVDVRIWTLDEGLRAYA
ncbi:MAG: hypothetical protein M0P31_10290 [Solirubrobacteraceae bacterium]|nr:hypothetical protein [Solirubrobacteraceae bacterium]